MCDHPSSLFLCPKIREKDTHRYEIKVLLLNLLKNKKYSSVSPKNRNGKKQCMLFLFYPDQKLKNGYHENTRRSM